MTLDLDFVAWGARVFSGRLGMSECPGSRGELDADLAELRGEADMLVSLLSDEALAELGVAELPERARRLGLAVRAFPIADFGVPEDVGRFRMLVEDLARDVRAGQRVVVHCGAGLGRSGMLAASVLVELGFRPDEALAEVRRARPGTIETPAQERVVAEIAALRNTPTSVACPNFRDVGAALEALVGRSPIPRGRLLRGGRIDAIVAPDETGSPRTIVNLRPAADTVAFGARLLHVPSEQDVERYEVGDPRVRRWLSRVLRAMAGEDARLPILVHCVSGKDRTGVVIAAILSVLDVPRDAIVSEYMLSEGELWPERIKSALDRLRDPAEYFRGVELARLIKKLCER